MNNPAKGFSEPFPVIDCRSRAAASSSRKGSAIWLPPASSGLECVVAIDRRYAAAFLFRDAPRAESRSSFVSHLGPKHRFARVMIVSGNREPEVRYLAEQVGITAMAKLALRGIGSAYCDLKVFRILPSYGLTLW